MPTKPAIPHLYLPMRSPRDVIPHLGRGEAHWRAGYSAHAVATSWFEVNDLPPAVRATLDTSPKFAGAELVDAFLERSTDLGDGYRPSQTDLLALLGLPGELAVMGVEAKVEESFGPRVGEWLSQGGARQQRLERLCGALELEPGTIGDVRYQLLHRTVSALLEARRYRARTAVMLVHSFSSKRTGLGDLAEFTRLLGCGETEPGQLVGPVERDGIALYCGWVADQLPDELG